MKIKDIVNEAGFWSGFKQNILPSPISTTLKTLRANPLSSPKQRLEKKPEYFDLAKQAHAKFGDAPGKEGTAELGWLTPEQLAKLPKEVLDHLNDEQKEKLGVSPASPSPASSPITHPDVSVTSSYPLRLRYKSGDYVLDPTTNQWRTVTGKRVAAELASFLQYQANKL